MGEERVVGLFGSLGYGRRLAPVRATIRAVSTLAGPVTILYAGGDGNILRSLPADWPENIRLVDLGKCPHDQVSVALKAMDVFAAPYRDGVSTRRGSFMAALQHGLPVITTLGNSTDKILREHNEHAFLAIDEAAPAAFGIAVSDLLQHTKKKASLRRAATSLYTRSFDWPVTTTQLHHHLST
jgi:glycosyltransferase involved in cell wall biosynthesis